MHEILSNHVHNINKPTIYEEGKIKELQLLIKNMAIDLINKSIRIN
jgi:hypothetical protein